MQAFGHKIIKSYMSNFHPLEVVGRGGKTKFQVVEKYNFIL